MIKRLSEATHKKVKIGYFGMHYPYNIEIKGFEIEDFLKADSISVSPGILGIVSGNLVLNSIRIIRPEFTYERIPAVVALEGSASNKNHEEDQPKIKPLRVIFKHIIIKDGKVNFIDRTVGPQGLIISAENVNFKLSNVYRFPHSFLTNFELKGIIPWGNNKGSAEAVGWFDFGSRDMQVDIAIKGIDGVYLAPYYSQWFDLGKARIEKATLGFTANLQGVKNNLTATCHLELNDIMRKSLKVDEAEEPDSRLTSAALSVFKATDQGKVALDFTLRTKMDRPEFGFGTMIMAFDDKVKQVKRNNMSSLMSIIMLPSNILQGVVKGTADLSKSVIEGAFSVGKEVKDSVEETFKKEKTPAPAK
ncbi:MAG: DUF748 domain-containing protein [Candidatus Omnitrophota bacterium]